MYRLPVPLPMAIKLTWLWNRKSCLKSQQYAVRQPALLQTILGYAYATIATLSKASLNRHNCIPAHYLSSSKSSHGCLMAAPETPANLGFHIPFLANVLLNGPLYMRFHHSEGITLLPRIALQRKPTYLPILTDKSPMAWHIAHAIRTRLGRPKRFKINFTNATKKPLHTSLQQSLYPRAEGEGQAEGS